VAKKIAPLLFNLGAIAALLAAYVYAKPLVGVVAYVAVLTPYLIAIWILVALALIAIAIMPTVGVVASLRGRRVLPWVMGAVPLAAAIVVAYAQHTAKPKDCVAATADESAIGRACTSEDHSMQGDCPAGLACFVDVTTRRGTCEIGCLRDCECPGWNGSCVASRCTRRGLR